MKRPEPLQFVFHHPGQTKNCISCNVRLAFLFLSFHLSRFCWCCWFKTCNLSIVVYCVAAATTDESWADCCWYTQSLGMQIHIFVDDAATATALADAVAQLHKCNSKIQTFLCLFGNCCRFLFLFCFCFCFFFLYCKYFVVIIVLFCLAVFGSENKMLNAKRQSKTKINKNQNIFLKYSHACRQS